MSNYRMGYPGTEIRRGEVTQDDIDAAEYELSRRSSLGGVFRISCICPVYQALDRILGQVDAVGYSVYEQRKDVFDIEADDGGRKIGDRVAAWDAGMGMSPFPFRYVVKA